MKIEIYVSKTKAKKILVESLPLGMDYIDYKPTGRR